MQKRNTSRDSKKALASFKELVYAVVASIPEGKVMSYKQVAQAAGSPLAYRAVGSIMNKNPYAPRVPCHRVVKSDGEIGGFATGSGNKQKMLKREGVTLVRGKIDLAVYGYKIK